MPAEQFARLELLCRRVATLPVLPTAALQLIRMIDSGDASAQEIEKLIARDPALSAEFLRMSSNSQLGKPSNQVSSIKAGILRMGQRSVRALATSLLVRDLSKSDPNATLNQAQFARHSLAVGVLSKFLFARKKATDGLESKWSADEIFAAGLLSDLGYVLLSRMAPKIYTGIMEFSKRTGRSLDETFLAAFERHPSALAAAAAETWELPEIFKKTLTHIHEPWQAPEEQGVLCCLNYASALSRSFGMGMETWQTELNVPGLVSFEINISDEEQANLKKVLLEQLDSYLGAEAAA
ncbi:MAG TPA: HDOD domain-containing protein [Fimbriimonadaceae bacterium]